MRFVKSLYTSTPLVGTFKIGATVVAGQVVRWVSGGAGTIASAASTTSNPKAMGVTLSAGTYSTTQGAEGTATVVYDPFALFACRVVPSTTAGTAFADGDGSFLTADSANSGGTTVADTSTRANTSDAIDSALFCLSGANKGQWRVITAHTASTSVVVTVPFDSGIAAGDTFVFSCYGPGTNSVTLTSDYTQANTGSTILTTAGAEYGVLDARVDIVQQGTPTAPYYEIIIYAMDHNLNGVKS